MDTSSKGLRIGVALQSGPNYAAEILQGIVDYCREKKTWNLEVDSDYHYGLRPANMNPQWNGDGIIALSGENKILDKSWLEKANIPLVNATGWFTEYDGAPRIFWNDQSIAHLAANHLSSLGLDRFAYIGPKHYEPSHRRGNDFQRFLNQRK